MVAKNGNKKDKWSISWKAAIFSTSSSGHPLKKIKEVVFKTEQELARYFIDNASHQMGSVSEEKNQWPFNSILSSSVAATRK